MNDADPSSEISFRIQHTMLPVADMHRSVAFYTRMLGMKAMSHRVDEHRKVEVDHVGYGDRGMQPTLELTKDVSEGAPAEVRPTGIHVAIEVSDLTRLCGLLERERVDFVQQLKASGPEGRRLTAWIRDPDGHVLELIEIRAAA
jgi:lactoylglutathione lyase